MPGATVSYTNETPDQNYRIGFPLGFRIGNLYYLNNHVVLQILYEKQDQDHYRIEGFEVYPDSIARGECTKGTVEYQHQKVLEQRFTVSLTYSIRWKQVYPTTQARWDRFLIDPRPDRHRWGYVNNLTVALIVSGLVLWIVHKARKQRTSATQEDKVHEEMEDYVGWRLIDRDVFRRPTYGGLLPPLIGTGVQLILVAIGLWFALYRKWYHPAQPMVLTQWFTALFIFGSLPGGYASAKLYKVFRGKSWILNGLLTATLVPTLVLLILFVLSFFTWSQQSTLAISWGGWIMMVLIVLVVLVPATFLGAFLGEKRDRIEYPTRTTQLPRIIPKKQWYQSNMLR
ncbi:hypothetical protein BY458DRAFT_439880 [Sporodiniella umbellata]|nr:hypothetical protein BY458DRAFT_439880 [Sporodiniella umbellata]